MLIKKDSYDILPALKTLTKNLKIVNHNSESVKVEAIEKMLLKVAAIKMA